MHLFYSFVHSKKIKAQSNLLRAFNKVLWWSKGFLCYDPDARKPSLVMSITFSSSLKNIAENISFLILSNLISLLKSLQQLILKPTPIVLFLYLRTKCKVLIELMKCLWTIMNIRFLSLIVVTSELLILHMNLLLDDPQEFSVHLSVMVGPHHPQLLYLHIWTVSEFHIL